MSGDEHVLEHGVLPEQRRGLERSRDTAPADLRRAKPDVRSPLKKTSPAVSGITPVMRLKTVLLPAPLGPIRPWIAPRVTVMEKSATASKPPNRRETPRSSRSKDGSRSCGRPSPQSPEKAPGRAS